MQRSHRQPGRFLRAARIVNVLADAETRWRRMQLGAKLEVAAAFGDLAIDTVKQHLQKRRNHGDRDSR